MSGSSVLDSDCIDAATLEEVSGLELIARGAVEGARIGRHRSFLSGLSTNFTHHRAYVSGDEIRHIDWRVYSCLLYTSPSPRDYAASRMPSSA